MNKQWRQLLFKEKPQPLRPWILFQRDFWFHNGLSDVNPGNLSFVVLLVIYCCVNKLPLKLSSLKNKHLSSHTVCKREESESG